jgi:hypothetical protein
MTTIAQRVPSIVVVLQLSLCMGLGEGGLYANSAGMRLASSSVDAQTVGPTTPSITPTAGAVEGKGE